jgi:hypothetical protein
VGAGEFENAAASPTDPQRVRLEYRLRPALGQVTIGKTLLLPQGGVSLPPIYRGPSRAALSLYPSGVR